MNYINLNIKNADLLTKNCFCLKIYDENNSLICSDITNERYSLKLPNGIYTIEVSNLKEKKLYKVIRLHNEDIKLYFVFNLAYICKKNCYEKLTQIFLTDKFYNGLPIEKGLIIFE